MPKARAIVTVEVELERMNYEYTSDGRKRTPEELAALTDEQLLELEKAMLTEGVYGIDDLVGGAESHEVKWELVTEE